MDASVAQLVREKILSDPCLSECLARGVVNLSELARQLSSEIERMGLGRPRVTAVKMALYRLSRRLREQRLSQRVIKLLARSRIIIHDSVSILTFPGELMPKALAVAAEIASRARFIQVTQGFRNATIVVSSEDADRLVSRIGEPIDRIDGQTAIVIVSPEDIIETPGVISILTGYLASNGINITQIISCYVDTIIVLDTRDSLKAFNILHNIIHGATPGKESARSP